MAEWLRPVIFSALNGSSSYRCVLARSSGQMWNKPYSTCRFSGGFCRTCSSIRQHLLWVSCERNSSYSFVPIFLKLCMCFCHGMRMCIWFGYNCEVIFCHFFHFVNLVIFWPQCIDSGYLVSATPQTILYPSFETLHMFSPWSEDVHMVWI